jgi:hypothetical protein
MISERVLRKWRREALETLKCTVAVDRVGATGELINSSERILRLTQELMDEHLLKGVKENAIRKEV